MRRKKTEHIEEQHDRWLISYADFITLLFAFFVVMYAISSVNLEKYRAISTAIKKNFDTKGISQLDYKSDTSPFGSLPDVSKAKDNKISSTDTPGQDALTKEEIDDLSEKISDAFRQLINQKKLNVRSSKRWTEIELSSSLLFASGSAIPSSKVEPLLKQMAEILKPLDHPIRVEGFTDDRPINTEQFPSNWELSAARSAAVLRKLIQYGVNSEQLAAVGYGEQHPLANNASPQGRDKNRRVVIMISWDPQARLLFDPAQRQREYLREQASKVEPIKTQTPTKNKEPLYRIQEQRLESGGILIRRQQLAPSEAAPPKQ
ncbi:MAG: flagellar motor protein MotD [Gammaproteobacteria bacterium]